MTYLPVCFDNNSSDNIQKKVSGVRLVHSKRTDALRALHECIEHCLEPLANAAMAGLLVTTKDYWKI